MIDIINEQKQKKMNYDYLLKNNIANKTISELHSYIIEADEYVSKKINGKSFKFNLSKINLIKQIPKPESMDSHFFPKNIQKYVDDNAEYSLQFTCEIKKRNIVVYFILFEELTTEDFFVLNRYIHMIYTWIYILDIYSSKKCSETLTMYVYFTPFEKKLPDNQLITIDTEHVNTAYTTGCQKSTEIVLYRKEEWFKVFIHETFHNFGLDFSDMNLHSVNKKLRDIFNVNVEFNLYESYCEFWARTINTMMYTYLFIKLKNMDNNATTFKKLFKKNMEEECYHSLYQSLKILHFMDLKYKLITDKKEDNINICKYLYKENTSVFSYYIITALLMNNYVDCLSWCNTNNNMLIQFKKTPGNLESYIGFIYKCCNDANIKKNINTIENNLSTTPKENISPNINMVSLDITSMKMSTLNIHDVIL